MLKRSRWCCLPLICQNMPLTRHQSVAPTERRDLAHDEGVDVHSHDDHQIIFAESGVLEVITDAGTWFAPATRAIWIPAGTAHSWRAHGRLTVHMLGLSASDNLLTLEAPTVLIVSPLLRELMLHRTSMPDAASPAGRRLHAVLLDQLHSSAQQPMQLPTTDNETLAKVCAALQDNPADVPWLNTLAAHAHVSERTLSRLFRTELGMTFPQWRTQVRLFHALKMLAAGTPVTATAHACG